MALFVVCRKKPGWEIRRAKRKRASVGAKKGFKCGFCHTPGHKLPSCQNIHKIGDLININELGSVEVFITLIDVQ